MDTIKQTSAQVLAKFDKLDKLVNKQILIKFLEAITNNTAAINQNTVVAEATYNLVVSLLDKLDELKDNSNVNVSAILMQLPIFQSVAVEMLTCQQ